MKKKLLITALTLVLAVGAVRVFAAGGASNTTVSVSYLNNTFLPALEQTIQKRAQADTQAVYNAAVEKLDGLGASYMTALGATENLSGWSYSGTASLHELSRGDVLQVSAGSTLLWTAGAATATVGLVDATAGAEVAAGGKLTGGHRYLNGGADTAVTVTVLSDAATAALEGYWSLQESGEQVSVFTDLVQSKDWFYDAVRYVVDQGLFNGVTATQFSPNAGMDRSMLATVLYRMEGAPTEGYSGVFTDVKDGQWYTAGIEWAAANGIVYGVGDGVFLPSRSVTREQIASMLYRYAGQYLKLDVSQTGDLTSFSDSGKVSDWAEESMTWAVGAGIITGSDGGTLLPGNNATRAEVATMLQRLRTWMGTL